MRDLGSSVVLASGSRNSNHKRKCFRPEAQSSGFSVSYPLPRFCTIGSLKDKSEV